MRLLSFIAIVFVTSICALIMCDENLIVRTTCGDLQGKLMMSRGGRNFSAFLNVPYAAPPTGELRFQPPKLPQEWKGIRLATEEGNQCPQKGLSTESEDCLYLNVFTHNTSASSVVMVYIHGGGFYLGSSSLSHLGPEYLLDRDIVLVILQYRLGVFGFLSTGDNVVSGNMGLKDQVRALQWVQENIRAFGGDPQKVTIFGNSAGGASVHLHMKSPLSRNLFARAISQSGTAVSTFAMTSKRKARQDTENLAIGLNCPIQNSTEIIECLQNKSSSEILNAFKKLLLSKHHLNKLFRPVIEVQTDGAFLTSSQLTATTNIPWLLGVNANEGLFKVERKHINHIIHYIHSNFTNFGPIITHTSDLYSNLDEITNLIYNFYFGNTTTIEENIKSIEQLVTDTWFAWPTERAIQQHNGTFYYYLYDHESEFTYSILYGSSKAPGVSHTDELLALFTQKGLIPELNEQDTNISKLMVNFWVNFATEGNPTPSPINSNPQSKDFPTFIWEASNRSDPVHIHIQTDGLSMKKKLFSNRMNFWRQLPIRYL